MYASLSGTVKDIFSQFLIIDVNGVGYRVEGLENAGLLVGNKADVYVFTHVREQEIRLFGFKTRDELTVFENLLTVNGIGPRSAIALLNNLGISTILNAIKENKPQNLKSSGVGLKTAEKIVLELKSKLERINVKANEQSIQESTLHDETIQTLIGLGYSNEEAMGAVKNIKVDRGTTSETILREALKHMHKN
jgi:Holliday junction DNA helicase RuvA